MSLFEKETTPTQQTKSAASAETEQTQLARNPQVQSIIHLQQTIGNRALQRLLAQNPQVQSIIHLQRTVGNRGIQTRLAVSHPEDEYEKEAERVATHVTRMTELPVPADQPLPAAIQRKCAECEEEEKKGPAQHPPLPIQQSIEGKEDEYAPYGQSVIFRKADFAPGRTAPEANPSIADRLAGQRGGETVPAVTLQKMENAFGRDFSGVRLHSDAEAADLSGQLSALAFTQGNHIYFGHGMFDPEGSSGRHLLAHELTHVVQQGHAPELPASEATTTQTLQAAAQGIQRTATWGHGAVHEANNLADSVLNGPPVGITFPTLNGTILMGPANAQGAVAKPTLAFGSGASGGVTAQVATVPANTGSFDETVLAPGPWTIATPKTAIATRFPSLTTCTGAGNTDFRAIGNPSDAHMHTANRRHEDHHAADHHTAFNATIGAWDTRLTAAAAAKTIFNGAAQADAEAALHAAMGGTPDQVAGAYWDACIAAGHAFHGTPAGGPVGAPTSPTANTDCSNSSAKYHNPS